MFNLILFFSLTFLIRRWTSVDPHYAKKSDGNLKHLIFATLITSLYFILPMFEKASNLSIMITSFIVYSIYMPTINPPTNWREDEYESKFKAFITSKRIQFGGTTIIKLLFLLLSLILIGRYSPYWLVIIIIFGVYLQVSKALILNLLIQSDQGEWEDIIDYEKEEELMTKYSSIMKISVLAFIIFSFYFGIELVEYAELTPKNWNSYTSIIGGFALGIIIELIVE